MYKKIYPTILLCLLSFMTTRAQSIAPGSKIPKAVLPLHLYHDHTLNVMNGGNHYGKVTMASEDEELPFDNNTWSGYIMNWLMKLLLWFIYLSLIAMVLAITWGFLASRGIWSWVVAMIGAFFYAMWLGRYWGYTACLVSFVVLFSVIKIFLPRRLEIVQPVKASKKMKGLLRGKGKVQ